MAVIRWLALFGHELRRPKADFLRDGIYELRAREGRANYRVLYFFHGSTPMKKVSTNKPKKTRDALQIIDHMIGDDPELRKLVIEAGVNAHIAQLIYDARTRAGLTQAQLAKLIGTKQPVIARLEDADYHGHSLTMLQRIAEALNQRLEMRFIPAAAQARRTRLPEERLRA